MVCQQYSLSRKNFCGLPMTIYFSVLIQSRKIFSGETFAVCESHGGFPPQMFYHIWLSSPTSTGSLSQKYLTTNNLLK